MSLALTTAIFVLSYLLIAVRRVPWLPLGRTSGALLGAVLMVVSGALSPEQAYAAIDHDTLALLLGMMLITGFYERLGLFERIAQSILQTARSPFHLLVALSATAALGSAFLVNDTICLFLTPVVLSTCRNARLPLGPFLIALATSANIGSAATLVGNPQNMIIGGLSQISFTRFASVSAPVAFMALCLNIGLLWAYYNQRLPAVLPAVERMPSRPWPDLAVPTIAITALVVVAFFCGFHLGFTALAGALALMILDRKDPTPLLAKVDGSLLLFFAGLFVVVEGMNKTGLVETLWNEVEPWLTLTTPVGVSVFAAAVTTGSNLVSNVPLVLLAAPHVADMGEAAWILLAYVATLAGNLTLVGSVANLIVAEGAKQEYELGFVEYLRFGAVSTLLTIAAGTPLLLALAR